MLENLLNSISSNPAYLAVTIVLMAMITFSVIKRLFKLVTLGITLLIIYYAYIVLTGQQLPDLDKLPSQVQELQDSAQSVVEDNILEPLKEKTDLITDILDN
jgi:Ca2+/Na+ antiporter|tara:strand:+ start:1800 stop:2105 length:306 start_codon:yes stop_codon:yes gene_type:complete